MSQFDKSPDLNIDFYKLLGETDSVISIGLKGLDKGYEEKIGVFRPYSKAEVKESLGALIGVLTEQIGFYEQLNNVEGKRKVARKIKELENIAPELDGDGDVPEGFIQKVRQIVEKK